MMGDDWIAAARIAGQEHGAMTYPFETLARLETAERERAVTWLLERAGQGDVLAVESLGLLGEARALGAIARAEAAHLAHGAFALAASRARWRLEGTGEAGDARIAELLALARLGGVNARIDAAATLAEAPHPAALKSLVMMLSDVERTVRAHAQTGLGRYFGISTDASPRANPVVCWEIALFSRLPTVWVPAAQALSDGYMKMLAGADRGAAGFGTAEDGADPVVEEFWQALRARKPFPMDRFGALTESGKAWFRGVLEARLDLAAEDAPELLVELASDEAARGRLRDLLVETRALGRTLGGPAWEAMIRKCDAALEQLVPGVG